MVLCYNCITSFTPSKFLIPDSIAGNTCINCANLLAEEANSSYQLNFELQPKHQTLTTAGCQHAFTS